MLYLLGALAIVLMITGLWPWALGLGFVAFWLYVAYAVFAISLTDEEKDLSDGQ